MAEPDVAAPTAEAPAEGKEAPKAPTIKLDSSQSLQGQANKIIKGLGIDQLEAPKEEAPKDDEEKPADQPKEEAKEEPKEEAPAEQPDDEDDEPVTPAEPVELGTVEKYILDRLPTLTTRIKDGEGFKTVKFKDTAELPEGFELADDAARAQFTVDVAAQVNRAKDALAEFKQAELQENIRQFEAQEAQDVADDIQWLQRHNYLDKFQYAEDDPKFNSDPAVKTANEIYDLYKKTNQAYAEKFANTGRSYRISYRDAADKYFATQARTKANESQKAKSQPDAPKPKNPQATKERQEVARQQGAPAGGEPTGNRPKIKSGMRLSDINRLVSQGRI